MAGSRIRAKSIRAVRQICAGASTAYLRYSVGQLSAEARAQFLSSCFGRDHHAASVETGRLARDDWSLEETERFGENGPKREEESARSKCKVARCTGGTLVVARLSTFDSSCVRISKRDSATVHRNDYRQPRARTHGHFLCTLAWSPTVEVQLSSRQSRAQRAPLPHTHLHARPAHPSRHTP